MFLSNNYSKMNEIIEFIKILDGKIKEIECFITNPIIFVQCRETENLKRFKFHYEKEGKNIKTLLLHDGKNRTGLEIENIKSDNFNYDFSIFVPNKNEFYLRLVSMEFLD
jgi:hypothetical protein